MFQSPNPEILYKYRTESPETLKLLSDGEIFLSSISKFNDPFEGAIPYVIDADSISYKDFYKKLYPRLKSIHPEVDDQLIINHVMKQYNDRDNFLAYDEEHVQQTRRMINDSFGIFCLTTQRNNFLMWSHYTNSHKGLCIGFDMRFLKKIFGNLSGKVIYQEDLPKFKIEEEDDYMSFYRKLIWTKSKVWEYEDEYRLIMSKSANTILRLPLESIVEVIFGCEVDHKWKDEITRLVDLKLPHARIFESSISRTNFSIDIKQIK